MGEIVGWVYPINSEIEDKKRNNGNTSISEINRFQYIFYWKTFRIEKCIVKHVKLITKAYKKLAIILQIESNIEKL